MLSLRKMRTNKTMKVPKLPFFWQKLPQIYTKITSVFSKGNWSEVSRRLILSHKLLKLLKLPPQVIYVPHVLVHFFLHQHVFINKKYSLKHVHVGCVGR